MPRSLTQGQVDSFRRDGFLVVEDVLSAAEIVLLAERTDLIASGEAAHIPGSSIQLEPVFREGRRAVADRVLAVRKLYNIAVYDDLLWTHVTNDRVVDIAADLLGTDDIKMYADQLFMKGPETGSAQPWHQDSASWRDLFPMDLVTAWTAIDAATRENGCLEFAAGTHRWGMMKREQLAPHVPHLGRDPWPIVPAPLEAGSISFHHSLTLHRSGANHSAARRRGYAVHYMRATTVRDESVTDAPEVPPYRQVRGRSFPGCV